MTQRHSGYSREIVPRLVFQVLWLLRVQCHPECVDDWLNDIQPSTHCHVDNVHLLVCQRLVMRYVSHALYSVLTIGQDKQVE